LQEILFITINGFYVYKPQERASTSKILFYPVIQRSVKTF